jgi:hypothetical protein
LIVLSEGPHEDREVCFRSRVWNWGSKNLEKFNFTVTPECVGCNNQLSVLFAGTSASTDWGEKEQSAGDDTCRKDLNL